MILLSFYFITHYKKSPSFLLQPSHHCHHLLLKVLIFTVLDNLCFFLLLKFSLFLTNLLSSLLLSPTLMALSAFAFPSYITTKGGLTDSCCKSTSLSSSRSLFTDLPSPCLRPNNCHVRFTSLLELNMV